MPPARYFLYIGPTLLRRRSSNRQRPEVRRLELDGDAATPLAALEHASTKSRYSANRRQRAVRPACAAIAAGVSSCSGMYTALVGLRRERGVVEGEHEAVDEEHPLESARIQIAGHRHAIGDRGLDAQPVEHVVEILGQAARLRARFLSTATRVRALQIGKRKAEQRARGRDRLRVVVAQPKRRAARRRGAMPTSASPAKAGCA